MIYILVKPGNDILPTTTTEKQWVFLTLNILHTADICMQNVSLTNPRPKSRIKKLSDMTPASDTHSVADKCLFFYLFQLKSEEET